MSPEPNLGARSFRAMGVDVVVLGAGEAELLAVRKLFEGWELVFSRFLADSELSRVNRSASPVVPVSPLFARAVRTALDAAGQTDGLVDPTLGTAIESAGYDRDFDRLGEDDRPLGPAVPGAWRAIRLHGRLLSRPPGTVLDLNGVVKALAVDEAVALFRRHSCVAAGGDVAARGGFDVRLPGGESIRLLGGGLATSGTTYRRWRRGGELQHHLLDPSTGRPAHSRWLEVTVAAGSCLAADVAAKAAFLLSEDGPAWLDERGLAGRFSGNDEVVTNRSWREAVDTGSDELGAVA
jgi:FAD:protein FMN transferase